MRAFCLLGRPFVEEEGNEGVEDVGNPDGNHGGHVAVDGEGGGDGLEHDVREAQGQPDAQVQTHAALALARGQGHAYQRQDERGEGGGDALVVLQLELLDVGKAALPLPRDVVAQLGTGHHLLLVLHDEEVGRLHLQHGVHARALGDAFAHAVHLAQHVVLEHPLVHGRGVVDDGARRQVRHQLLALELVQRKAVARLAVVLEAVDVGNDARVYLELDVARRVGLARLVVLVLKVEAGLAALGDDVGAQAVGDHRDDACRHHVGAKHALEAHARGEHGDDFGILRQLRGEEDDGNEDEQRAEQVGEVGDEVQVVVEDDGVPRGIVRHEAVLPLVEVEHHGDGDNQGNGKHVGAQEFLDDVPVQPLQVLERRKPELPGLAQYVPYCLLHNLVDTRFTIMGFQVEKSPAMMCLRASVTSHR